MATKNELAAIKRERPERELSDERWLTFNLWADDNMVDWEHTEDWRPWYECFCNGWDCRHEAGDD